MKRKSLSFAVTSLLAGALIALTVPAYGQAFWQGPSPQTGGSGAWQNSNFTVAIGSATDVNFRTTSTYTDYDTTVTIAAGQNLRFRGLSVQNENGNAAKSVTLNLGDGANVHTGVYRSTDGKFLGVVNVGGLVTDTTPSTSSLTINGPETGAATFRAVRLYMEGNMANVNSLHRNSLIFNGSRLNVILDGSFSAAGNQSDILFDGGVKVSTTYHPDIPVAQGANPINNAGAFYVRDGMHGQLFDNWITVRNAEISLHTLDVRGLFQLGSEGTLKATQKQVVEGGPEELKVTVGLSNGSVTSRLEVAGNGIDHRATIQVHKKGTLAIGISNPATLERSAADTFTLNQQLTFAADSKLEFNIFGAGEENADRLIIGETGSIINTGTGPLIVLNLNGYTIQAGDAWSLIDTTDADENWLTGNFRIAGIDTNLWDLTDFNAAGNWTVRSVEAIPEPSTVVLLGLAGMSALGWMKRRRVS